MKVLIIGDLHTHPWDVYPKVKTGINEYLDMVRWLLSKHIPALVRSEGASCVAFLGDLMDDVARTERVQVGVLNLLIAAFRDLQAACPQAQIQVLRGNHDVAGSTDWLSALEGLGVVVAREPVVVGSVALLPWARKDEIQQALQEADSQGCEYVLGHWWLPGAKADNGYELPPSEAPSGPWASRFKRIILGDIHTPQGGEQDPVVYLGAPFRFSWASKDTGPRRLGLLDTDTNALSFIQLPCPAFVGPTEDLSGLATLPEGSFVRLRVASNNQAFAVAVARQFPLLRITPFLQEAAPVAAPRLRLVNQEELARGQGMAPTDKAAVLTKYVDYCVAQGSLPSGITREQLLEMGVLFLPDCSVPERGGEAQ